MLLYALCPPTKDIDFDKGAKGKIISFLHLQVLIYILFWDTFVLCAFKHTKQKVKEQFSKDNHRQVQYACLFFYYTKPAAQNGVRLLNLNTFCNQ